MKEKKRKRRESGDALKSLLCWVYNMLVGHRSIKSSTYNRLMYQQRRPDAYGVVYGRPTTITKHFEAGSPLSF
jgi:uncharacterized protein (UPF0548 family)